MTDSFTFRRRALLTGLASAIGGHCLGTGTPLAALPDPSTGPGVRPEYGPGSLIVDLRAAHLDFWTAAGGIRRYPISVSAHQRIRRGWTEIVRGTRAPTWARGPGSRPVGGETRDFIPPGPHNPLGSHALYLAWPYHRIHGGRDPSGSTLPGGCIHLSNADISAIYETIRPGMRVLLL